jgi:hypothetical protein
MSETKFNVGDRVKITHPLSKMLLGTDEDHGTVVHAFAFSGHPEYSVRVDGADSLWIYHEKDLEAAE